MGPVAHETETAVRGKGIVLVGCCLVIGSTFIVMATFNYMLTPMLAELGLTRSQASLALRIPARASLLVVFVAGLLGDRLGHRRVITWMTMAFIAGSVMVMLAQGLPLVAAGMLVEGIGATAIQIVVVGLITATFVEPRQRAAAFATYGMVFPAVYLAFPLLGGFIAANGSWRLVAAMWVVAGVLMLAVAMTMLPREARREPLGEVRTPLLAGAFVVLVVQAISLVTNFGLVSWQVLATAGVAAVILGILAVQLRRQPAPSLSLQPLRSSASSLLLVVVILVPLLNTFFYITIGFEYLYGFDEFQTALALVPAQVCAIVGAKLLAGPMMRRNGPLRSGVQLLIVLAAVMLMPLIAGIGEAAWRLAVYASLFGALSVAISVVVVTAVMNTSIPGEEGATATYRGAASAVGAALGVVIMSTIVFAAGRQALRSGLEGSGLSPEAAAQAMRGISDHTSSPEVLSDYSVPLPDGTAVSQVEKEAVVAGLRANGVAGAVISLAGAGVLAYHRRRHPDTEGGDRE